MPTGILFVVVHESRAAQVGDFVRNLIVPDRRHTVQILDDANASQAGTDVGAFVTAGLIEKISAYPPKAQNRLIIDREARCSIAQLESWWLANEFGNAKVERLAPIAVKRAIKQSLENSGSDWRTRASTEIAKFDGPPGNLDAWLQQFGSLGYTPIGRKIAAKLRVIKTANLPGLKPHPADAVGHRQASCYVHDDDQGGSWLEMQGLLSHTCPPGSVFPIHWDTAAERLSFPDVPVDEFVIYEDGLWSGSETVRRLRAMAAAPPPAPVTLRFGVVTDFGLMVTRQAIRSLGLSGRVSVEAWPSELIDFLGEDLPARLRLGLETQPEAYFSELHQHVSPYAFKESEDWTTNEIGVCRTIGRQLVRYWLSEADDQIPTPEKIERFALGGGQFASTVIFSRSVPKVCLPLLWLDGPIMIEEKKVNWRPFFVDARRISNTRLLYPEEIVKSS